MKKQLPAWLVLCIIALVAGLLLGLTNAQTAPKIEEQSLIAANAARMKVLPAADTFAEEPLQDSSFAMDNCYIGRAGGEVVGYVGQMTVKGYGGEIEVVAGVDRDGVITGVSVGGANFSETAGLGAKTKDAAFTDQFTGITPPAVLKENIDSVTGASISSGAVVSAVNQIYAYISSQELGLVTGQTTPDLTAAFRTETVTVQGYGGEIEVTVGINEDGSVMGVDIGGPNFHETANRGERVLEAEFRNQFIGATAPVAYGDGIDQITGATVTSSAVLNAINQALGEQAPVAPETAEAETLYDSETATVGQAEDGSIEQRLMDATSDYFA